MCFKCELFSVASQKLSSGSLLKCDSRNLPFKIHRPEAQDTYVRVSDHLVVLSDKCWSFRRKDTTRGTVLDLGEKPDFLKKKSVRSSSALRTLKSSQGKYSPSMLGVKLK